MGPSRVRDGRSSLSLFEISGQYKLVCEKWLLAGEKVSMWNLRDLRLSPVEWEKGHVFKELGGLRAPPGEIAVPNLSFLEGEKRCPARTYFIPRSQDVRDPDKDVLGKKLRPWLDSRRGRDWLGGLGLLRR